MSNKRVKITACESKLRFVKAIMEATGKSLLESKNIADSVMTIVPGFLKYRHGTLLLNESSITPEQWEKIAQNVPDLKWEYV